MCNVHMPGPLSVCLVPYMICSYIKIIILWSMLPQGIIGVYSHSGKSNRLSPFFALSPSPRQTIHPSVRLPNVHNTQHPNDFKWFCRRTSLFSRIQTIIFIFTLCCCCWSCGFRNWLRNFRNLFRKLNILLERLNFS